MLYVLGALAAAILVAVFLSSDWDRGTTIGDLGRRLGFGVAVGVLIIVRLAALVSEIAGVVLMVLKLAAVEPVASYSWGFIIALMLAPFGVWILAAIIED